MTVCPNCNSRHASSDKFCAECGQSTTPLNRSIFDITLDATKELLEIDGKLSRTIKMLFLHPGKLSEEFELGRRTQYSRPLRMYLVTSVILFFILASFRVPYEAQADLIQVSFLIFPVGMLEQIPKLMFFLLPVYGIILKMFDRRRFYVFYLIFSLHLHTVFYLLFIVLFFFSNLWPRQSNFARFLVFNCYLQRYLSLYCDKEIVQKRVVCIDCYSFIVFGNLSCINWGVFGANDGMV